MREILHQNGYITTSQIIEDKEIEYLLTSLSKIEKSSTVRQKNDSTYGVRNLLNIVPEIRGFIENIKIKNLVENILNGKAKPVRAIFFDKTSDANWKVPWHQDLTIAVKNKIPTSNFTIWTQKANIQHVQPPIDILEKMVTLRLHLDDSDETNGALKVVPKSHLNGRLNSLEIQNIRQANGIVTCSVKRGDAILMRPLIVHSSSAGTNPSHRRVIHIEYSAENLPNGLEWYGS